MGVLKEDLRTLLSIDVDFISICSVLRSIKVLTSDESYVNTLYFEILPKYKWF